MKRFQKILKEKKIDFCLLFNSTENKKDYHLIYFLQEQVGYGCLAIGQKKSTLYVPGFEYWRVKEHVNVPVVHSKKGLFTQIRKEFSGSIIGINKSVVSLVEFEKLQQVFTDCTFVDINDECKQLRMVKTNAEMTIMREAAALTDTIIADLFERLREFKTEKDIDKWLRVEVVKRGVVLSFDPIVAVGKNAYYPHHEPDGSQLKGFCVIDFGIKYKHYCTDMTRTVYFGSPSKEEQDAYELVLHCQEELIAGLKGGMTLKDVQESCLSKLGNHAKDMIHSVGHSVGLEVHDPLPRKCKHIVKGMVFTIEPGIYLKNKFGIRIEDDIYVGNKNEILSSIPKALVVIPIDEKSTSL